jgi:hypothetical protein
MGSYFGGTAALSIAVVYAMFLPASLIILAVSHSMLASLNPVKLFELIKRCRFVYLVGPAFVIAATWVVVRINVAFNIDMLTEFVSLYLIFAAFAIFGGMVRPLHLNASSIFRCLKVSTRKQNEIVICWSVRWC